MCGCELSMALSLNVSRSGNTGNLFLFEEILAPNIFKGSVTLEKSLFDKLLSPIIFIVYGELINKPKISLPNVPEF